MWEKSMDELLLLLMALFGISVLFHIIALERKKLADQFGETKGRKIGNVIGIVSGWLLFASWAGIWFVPQPAFSLPILPSFWISIPMIEIQIPIIHFIVGLFFLVFGAYFGLSAVSELSLSVSQTQLPNELVTNGIYAKCRHPQYLGGVLAHIGVSLLISGLYSFLLTPVVFVAVYAMSLAEEKQLTRMFGERYKDYKGEVPMLLPQIGIESLVSEG
ncbi:MAG: hypothetical protein GF309_06760 [Candidatus Lokiarchaeota archaeon]|nr:hypothetical protein [Candidatus Lokiarchaeota archaeon]